MTRKSTSTTKPKFVVKPLEPSTWPAFARLVEANNGVWGGVWCAGFHLKLSKGRTSAQNRAERNSAHWPDGRFREPRLHAHTVNLVTPLGGHQNCSCTVNC